MIQISKSYILGFIILAAFLAASAVDDSVMMSDIKALTFYKGKYTTGKRTRPILQLTRFGGNAKGYEPEVVQCQNVGTDDKGNTQWKCESNMPERYSFGKVSVSCEGYRNKGDKRVLKGSCGLKYELNAAAPKRKEKPQKRTVTTTTTTKNSQTPIIEEEESGFFSTFFTILFIIGVIVFIIVIIKCCSGDSETVVRPTVIHTTSSNPFASASAPPFVPSYSSYTHNTYVSPAYVAPSTYTTTTTTTTTTNDDSEDEKPMVKRAAYASTEYREETEKKEDSPKKSKTSTKTAYGESEESR